MANLKSFIYCANAERAQIKTPSGMVAESLNAIGIITTITPEFIPSTFSFAIVFSILEIDITKEHVIRVIFSNNEGDIIADTNDIKLPEDKSENKLELPPEFVGLNLSLDFRNVVFEKEGTYNTEVYFDGGSLGKNSIYVKSKRKV